MSLRNRPRFIGGIFLVCALLLFVTLFTVQAETNPVVVFFEVEGNREIPVEQILGLISNTQLGQPLDYNRIQQDRQAIMALGFFSDVQFRVEKMLDGVNLIFEVFENPIFKDFEIKGLTQLDPDVLTAYFTQKPGAVFNAAVFYQDLSRALKSIQEKQGFFIRPKSNGAIQISEQGTVQLQLMEMKFGKIQIAGLTKTKEFVVRRELSCVEGEIINLQTLFKEDLPRVMRLRLFDGINPIFEPGLLPDTLDLTLEITESTKTATYSLGLTYSQNTGNLGGTMGLSDPNLMGLGQNLSLDVNFTPDSTNVQFSFFEPWLDNKQTSFGLSMWNTDSKISSTMMNWYPPDSEEGDDFYNLNLVKTGLSLSFGRRFRRDTSIRMKMNFEKNNVAELWQYKIPPATTANPTPSPTLEPVPFPADSLIPQEFWDNSLELEAVHNRLKYEDASFVNGGYQLMGSYRINSPYLGGTLDYQQVSMEGKLFHQVVPNLVIGSRLQGVMMTGDHFPDYNSLYLGGMFKLRGYDDKRSKDTIDLIGDRYLLSNTELRYRLPANKSLEFVLFYDAGQIYNGTEAELKYDYGIGLRLNIPYLGVIRLDQAWNAEGNPKFVVSLGELF